MQQKILTADKLEIRNWPCNPICSLCNSQPETALHLSLNCTYARQVWEIISSWSHNIVQVPEMDIGSIQEWWNKNVERVPKDQKRLKAAVMIYTAWHIWNERNRRIFTSTALQPPDVARMIREDMSLRARACGHPQLHFKQNEQEQLLIIIKF
ncbi:hypothetical protein EJB05_25195, partial [Eragrostis curvula]